MILPEIETKYLGSMRGLGQQAMRALYSRDKSAAADFIQRWRAKAAVDTGSGRTVFKKPNSNPVKVMQDALFACDLAVPVIHGDFVSINRHVLRFDGERDQFVTIGGTPKYLGQKRNEIRTKGTFYRYTKASGDEWSLEEVHVFFQANEALPRPPGFEPQEDTHVERIGPRGKRERSLRRHLVRLEDRVEMLAREVERLHAVIETLGNPDASAE